MRPLQPWSKAAWLLLSLEAELGIIHIILAFQSYRTQELQDFKEKCGRPDNVSVWGGGVVIGLL